MKKAIIISALCLLPFVAEADERFSFNPNFSGPTAVVAASNAPTALKQRANYICDGTNDEVQINAALVAYNTVTLTEGLFSIGATITEMKAGKCLRGVGVYNTMLLQEADVPMVVISEAQGVGIGFILFEDMYLKGNATIYTSSGNDGIKIETSPLDVHFKGIYISSFAGYGISCVGAWGMILSNVILERNGLGEFYQDTATSKTITGTSTGAFAIGDTVTQDTSGATGTVEYVATADSGVSLRLCKASSSLTASGNPLIRNDKDPTNIYFTPTNVVINNTTGAKMLICKIQDNITGYGVHLKGTITGTLIIDSEFQSNVSGKYSIYLEGAVGSVIMGSRFLDHHASASGYINIGGNVTTTRNNVQGNYFTLKSDAVPAVVFGSTNAFSNIVTGNIIHQNYSTPVVNPIVRASGQERNIVNNNLFTNSVPGDISHQYQNVQWQGWSDAVSSVQKASEENTHAGWTSHKRFYLPAAVVGLERIFYVTANKYLSIQPAPLIVTGTKEGTLTAGDVVTQETSSAVGTVISSTATTLELNVTTPTFAGTGTSYTISKDGGNYFESPSAYTTPESVAIAVGGAQQAASKYIESTAIGDYIWLKCLIAGEWECLGVKGTWVVVP